jgi:uncharacterized cupin superfamily protein
VPEDCNQELRFEALRKGFVNEFQRTKEIAHRLVDDLTAISRYAEIMLMRAELAQTYTDLKKIVDRAKKLMALLHDCISNLHEEGRKHNAAANHFP